MSLPEAIIEAPSWKFYIVWHFNSHILGHVLKLFLFWLDQLSTQTKAGLKQLHEDFHKFKLKIKADVKAIKTVIRDLEKATEFIQDDVEDLKMKINGEETERTTLTARIDVLEKTSSSLG